MATHNDISKDNLWLKISCFIVFITFTLSLSTPHGYDIGIGLALLCGLITFKNSLLQQGSRDLKNLMWIIGLCGLYMLITFFRSKHAFSIESEIPIRYMLMILMLAFFYRYPPQSSWIWYGLGLGGIGVAGVTIYASYFSPVYIVRASPYMNPIALGTCSILLSTLSIPPLFYCFKEKQYLTSWLLFLGFLGGVIGSVLSESRGSWMGCLFALLIMLLSARQRLFSHKKTVVMGIILFLLTGVFIGFWGKNIIDKRVNLISTQISHYYEQNNTSTSIGTRLELWHYVFKAFPKHLIFGAGRDQALTERHEMVTQKEIAPQVDNYYHMHNDFLDSLAVRGLVGTLFLLACFILPFLRFCRAYDSEGQLLDSLTQTHRLSGLAAVGTIFAAAQTDCIMTMNVAPMMMYFFSIAVFYSKTKALEKQKYNKKF